MPIRPLPSPCDLRNTPRPSRRAARVRSGPGSALGNPLEISRCAKGVAHCKSRASHTMKSNNNAEGLARFLKLPPGASWATSC